MTWRDVLASKRRLFEIFYNFLRPSEEERKETKTLVWLGSISNIIFT